LPGDWREIVDPEGTTAIVGDPRVRRIRGTIAVVLALAASTVAAVVVRGSVDNPNEIGLAVLSLAIAMGLVWGALRITRVRDEWRYERGRLTLRRRAGRHVKDLLEAASLELTATHDSDGRPLVHAHGRGGRRRAGR
jgi:hypothetical protein